MEPLSCAMSAAPSFSPEAMAVGSLTTSRSSWSTLATTTSCGPGFPPGVHGRIWLEDVGKRVAGRKGGSQAVVWAQNRNVDGIGNTLRALQSRNRFPRKWLGQHYMVNDTVNERIVDAANIRPDDLVLEIGPGTGSLTKVLVDAGARVIAVEKDPDMASLMRERFQECDRVQVVEVDFLKWPVGSVMRKLLDQESLTSQQPKLAKVVSNLPFNITTHVIKRLLPMGDIFSRVVFLLQDEAALRLTNVAPAPVDYRPMTILVNFFSVPEYKFQVPRRAFFPEPRVDGGVISFELKTSSDYPPVGGPKMFFSMINSAFNGKRKMLRNTLQHLFKPSDVQVALLSGGFPETARPEELTLEDFVVFFNTVSSMSAAASEATVEEVVQL